MLLVLLYPFVLVLVQFAIPENDHIRTVEEMRIFEGEVSFINTYIRFKWNDGYEPKFCP